MQLEYRLSLKDYQEANQAHYKAMRFWYFLNWGLSLFLILLALVYIVIRFRLESGFVWDLIEACFLLFLGIFLNPDLNLPFQRYFIALSWKNHPSLRETMNLEFTQEWMNLKGESFESKLRWKIFVKFLETKNLFLLYHSKIVFNMIPKRAFNSDEEIQQFREMLSTKIRKS
jgi:hypothetical protein